MDVQDGQEQIKYNIHKWEYMVLSPVNNIYQVSRDNNRQGFSIDKALPISQKQGTEDSPHCNDYMPKTY